MPEAQARDLCIALQNAVVEERTRLAREIHDTLIQALSGIKFQADRLDLALGVDDTEVRRALERIQELARSGLDETRRAVVGLRPEALEGSTLSEALEKAARRFSREQNFSCEFRQIGRIWKLSAPIEDALYRIAHEAMTNAKKHAQARSALVHLEYRSRQIVLTVRDNGVGFAETEISRSQNGHGLKIMRERAQNIGGHLDIQNPVTGGAEIRVIVPSSVRGGIGQESDSESATFRVIVGSGFSLVSEQFLKNRKEVGSDGKSFSLR